MANIIVLKASTTTCPTFDFQKFQSRIYQNLFPTEFLKVEFWEGWKGRDMSQARDAINSMSQFIWWLGKHQQWTWILLPRSSPQPFVTGAIENVTIILKTGTNPGKIFVPFSLNVDMISFVRALEVGSVFPTARLLLHWILLGFMDIGVMDSAVIWEASVHTFRVCPLWRSLWSFPRYYSTLWLSQLEIGWNCVSSPVIRLIPYVQEKPGCSHQSNCKRRWGTQRTWNLTPPQFRAS